MSEATRLLKEALGLPAEARAAPAAKLIDSLDAEVDEGAETRWAEGIERRLTDVDAGHVTPVAWSEVRAAILRR